MRLLPLILATLVASCLAPTVSEAQTANNFTAPPPPAPVNTALPSVPAYTCVKNYYISPTGNDSNPGTLAYPWQTLQRGNQTGAGQRVAGDCVNVEPGTYNMSAPLFMEIGGNANTPTGYVVYRSVDTTGNYSPGTAHIFAAQALPIVVKMMNPYEILDGFEVDGNNGAANNEGIGNIDEGSYPNTHHIILENNIIHGAGGHGIYLTNIEYFWVLGNTIYNNALDGTQYWAAGIAIYRPQSATAVDPVFTPNAADNALKYHIFVENNVVYHNVSGVNCGGVAGCGGMGILLDRFNNKNRTGGVEYPYNTLVTGNYVYNNGSIGIQADYNDSGGGGITIANNSAYNNNLDPNNGVPVRSELYNTNAPTTWVNNIAYAVPSSGTLASNIALGNADSSGPTWNNTITYNGTAGRASTSGTISGSGNQLGVNPLFTNPSGADFTLQSGSPAITAGLSEVFLTSSTPNIGAFQ